MQTLSNTLTTMCHSSVMVVYSTPNGTWRGFVVPFDLSFEGSSKEEVETVLKSMINSYVDGLRKYNNPAHLSAVPLSEPSDVKKWSDIAMELIVSLNKDVSKISGSDYYAEAQLPA